MTVSALSLPPSFTAGDEVLSKNIVKLNLPRLPVARARLQAA